MIIFRETLHLLVNITFCFGLTVLHIKQQLAMAIFSDTGQSKKKNEMKNTKEFRQGNFSLFLLIRTLSQGPYEWNQRHRIKIIFFLSTHEITRQQRKGKTMKSTNVLINV